MTSAVDQRRSLRFTAPGVACLQWGRRARRYTVENLSLGGALLLGSPCPEVGEHVSAQIRVEGMRPLRIGGEVVRATAGARPSFAVAITNRPAFYEDAIHDLWLRCKEQPRAPVLLLVARNEGILRVMRDVLTRLEWDVATAHSPLEAINYLEQHHGDVAWVIALDSLTQTSGSGLLTFVGDTYPGVHRLLICDCERDGEHEALRTGAADALMITPVNPRQLADVVGKPTVQ